MSLVPAVFLFASCSQSDPVVTNDSKSRGPAVESASGVHLAGQPLASDAHTSADAHHDHGATAESEKSAQKHHHDADVAHSSAHRPAHDKQQVGSADHKQERGHAHNSSANAKPANRHGDDNHKHQPDAQPAAGDQHRAGKKHDQTRHAAHAKDGPPRKTTAGDQAAAVANAEKDAADLELLSALEIFSRRILPIMKADNASSCADCHLSGVDLKNYILDDQAQTFAAMRDHGLINVADPDKSKILTFISRTPDKPSPISDKVRQQEFRAFRAWIVAAVKEPELLKTKAAAEADFPTNLPVEVIRHARKDRVLSSFVDNVWSQMGRCIHCHSPNLNQRLIEKHGQKVSWIVPRDPAATLDKLVNGGNIDVEDPEESLVLLKPAGLADHGGGPKFLVGDTAYKQFLTFVKDYAAAKGAQYKTAADLPKPRAEVTHLTNQHLRITGVPERFGKMPLKVDLYRWDSETKSWSPERWATAFGPVNGKQSLWQNMMTATAPRDSDRVASVRREEPLLPPGNYLAKIFIDRDGKVAKDPDYELADREFVVQVEITGDWPPGYQPPKTIAFPRVDARID
jgi:hypothetical protein